MPAIPVTERGHPGGRVTEIWRYPVKSLVGERLQSAVVDERGLVGDRVWSVRDADGKFGSGKSTRRFRRMEGLLDLSASYDVDVPVIAFPNGRRIRGDNDAVHAALSRHLGLPVRLGREEHVSHFDEGPIHLLTTASVQHLERAHDRSVDVRRLRPNLLLDAAEAGLVEDGWIGCRLAIGANLILSIRCGMTRCVMVDLPQLKLDPDGRLLKAIAQMNETTLGVVADVIAGGCVAVGDPAVVID